MRVISKKDLIVPKRAKRSKKGDSGRVLIIGGSEDYVGALVLSGLAALRAGVDWVTVACPLKVGWAVHALSADLVVKKFNCSHFTLKHVNALLKLEKNFDVVLIGNGLGRKSDAFVQGFVRRSKKPLVIDADGIKAVSLGDVSGALFTPHAGEYAGLLKRSKVSERELRSHLNGNVILLKGASDTIISSSKVVLNGTGNPGMAKAGTGDVLAGLCLGFLGQGLSLSQSAVNGAYINGALGDLLLKKKKGYSYIASDLLMDLKHIL
ncbi:MAG: NAD(P)H-hydrate dehydratase [Nanoarchaeota archaeon]|nr:NAD(P)H-hydrate dehydratase [Nanoarchaeota archaeon]